MTKSCERPGCSGPGVVACTFDRASLTVVLTHFIGELNDGSYNVMCTRHADILTVPKGWTIDDRREDPPRLFAAPGKKPSTSEKSKDATSSIARRRKSRNAPSPKLFDQIALVTKLETSPVMPEHVPVHEEPLVEAVSEDVVEDTLEPVTTTEDVAPVVEETVDADATKAWKPQFDRTDDLGGVLRPKGKLLSRAFGLDDTVSQQRPEPTDRLEREPFNEHDIP
ncbi:MAG: DUF3499 family protein [Actinomycetota bacterium]